RRQAARRAVATVVPEGPRRIWHQAHSVPVPDEQLGDELDAVCPVSLDRSVVAAVATLERAAQLSSDTGKRTRRFLRAARYATALGRADVVERYIAAALKSTCSVTAHMHAELLRTGDDNIDLSLIVDHARRALTEGEPDRALVLLGAAAERAWWTDA